MTNSLLNVTLGRLLYLVLHVMFVTSVCHICLFLLQLYFVATAVCHRLGLNIEPLVSEKMPEKKPNIFVHMV